jgi:membrane associated rhomboid family serine protease
MIPAAVGFQCPQCVHEARQSIRQPVTPAGGAIVQRPTVTYVLIAINLAIFGLQLVVGINEVASRFGMWPVAVAINGEWFRLISAAFLHGSFLHIAFNMYVLYALGPTLERILGHVRYLILYLVAAIGGGVVSYAFSDIRSVSVGASGAIFGLMGALLVAGRRLGHDVRQVALLLGINVVIGFIAPGIDWRAHLGGLVAGALAAAVLVYAPKRHRSAWQFTGIALLLCALLALAVWRTAAVYEFLGPVLDNFSVQT